jgi:hypothetical protein
MNIDRAKTSLDFGQSLKKIVAFRKDSLLTYEREVLASLGALMPTSVERIFHDQLNAAKVTREADGMFVRFYWDHVFQEFFPNDFIEVIAGYAFFHGSQESIRSDLFISNGKLVAIYFNRPPAQLLFTSTKPSSPLLLADLSIRPAWSEMNPGQIAKILSRFKLAFTPSVVKTPRSEQHIVNFIARFETSVNSEWSDLLRETDGFELADAKFSGTNARTLPYHGGLSLQLIAERKDTRLGLGFFEGDHATQLYLIDEEGGDEERMDMSFTEALNTFFRRSQELSLTLIRMTN